MQHTLITAYAKPNIGQLDCESPVWLTR